VRGCFNKENSNAFYMILYHLIMKLADDPDMIMFKVYYPPRNSNDGVEFKKLCLEQIFIF
jgi:hypothetical protein